METFDDELELPEALRELVDLDEQSEREILDRILRGGWDLGAVFSLVGDRTPPPLSPTCIWVLHEKLGSRPALYPDGPDPFEAEPPPRGHHPDASDAYIVLNQRCDLIKGIAKEPLVKVAPARPIADRDLAASIANRTNATHAFLERDADGRVWASDLRMSGYVPKTWLKDPSPHFPLAPGWPRRRLGLEVAGRYSRAPVPTHVVEGLQRPVQRLYKQPDFRDCTELFSELIVLPDDNGRWQLIAVTDMGVDADEAAKDFDVMLGLILGEIGDFPLDRDGSDALRVDELSVADYFASFTLDMSRITYGQKASQTAQAEPGSWQGPG